VTPTDKPGEIRAALRYAADLEDVTIHIKQRGNIISFWLDDPAFPSITGAHVVARSPNPRPLSVSQDGTQRYHTIGDAIRAATKGSRIIVYPGHYNESLLIQHDVDIVGVEAVDGEQPHSVVLESGRGSALTVHGASACISYMTIVCQAEEHADAMAVDLQEARLTMTSCDIISTTQQCIAVRGAGAGVAMGDCRVQNCSGDGLIVGREAGATLEDCTIKSNGGRGLHVDSGIVVVRRCGISDNGGTGVSLVDAALGMFDRSEVLRNRGGDWDVDTTSVARRHDTP
jgi:hypothetical protein